MRLKEKEISSENEILNILKRARICHLALSNENQPYMVPLHFGYYKNRLYFHSASEGKKLTMIRKNPDVCFSIVTDIEIIQGETACQWQSRYRSITGFGTASLVTDSGKKIEALNIIMSHYTEGPFEYDQKALDQCLIIQIDIRSMTGKKSGQ